MPDGHHGLVLQGGGALGAFELGVARAIYAGDSTFNPGVIAGVSIGAITAVLLGRPAKGLSPLQALEAFWDRVTVSRLFPNFLQPYVSLFGLRNFYSFNPWWAFGTNIYSTAPLRATLGELVDQEALADPKARPLLCFTATDIEAGELRPFMSEQGGWAPSSIASSPAMTNARSWSSISFPTGCRFRKT